MRTFFFSFNADDCSSSCSWQTCPQRYLSALRKVDVLQNIRTFSGQHACVSSEPGSFPRNGDLIILYVKDLQDLNEMIRTRDIFDGLKKILVVANPEGADGGKYHMLAPRYITQAGRDITELEAVIHKMKEFVH